MLYTVAEGTFECERERKGRNFSLEVDLETKENYLK